MAVCCGRLPQRHRLLALEAYRWPPRNGRLSRRPLPPQRRSDARLKFIDDLLAASGSLGGLFCLRLKLINGRLAADVYLSGVSCLRLRLADGLGLAPTRGISRLSLTHWHCMESQMYYCFLLS